MKKTLRLIKALSLLGLLSSPAYAGELLIKPSIDLSLIATDNVDPINTAQKQENSFVTQLIPSVNVIYDAAHANFKMDLSNTFLNYSHDSNENGDIFSLSAEGSIDLNKSGLRAVLFSDVYQLSRSNSKLALVDLVTMSTIQLENYKAGFEYNRNTLSFSLNSSLIAEISKAEDGIDEREGFSFSVNGGNGPISKNLFWRTNSFLADYSSKNDDTTYYKSDIMLGWITGQNINPYFRFYNEDVVGSLAVTSQGLQKLDSIGFGLNVHSIESLNLLLSYNKTIGSSDIEDYIAAILEWKPSDNTELNFTYGRRFYGNSYEIDFVHVLNVVTNVFSYNENLTAFDRNSYETQFIGFYWCPLGDVDSFTECDIQGHGEINGENSQLLGFSNYLPVQSKEYTLNKTAKWNLNFRLYRMDISLRAEVIQRRHLSSTIEDIYYRTGIDVIHDLNSLSDISFGLIYRRSKYDVNKISNAMQYGTYKMASIKYKRELNSTLFTTLELKHVDEISNRFQSGYKETRFTLSLIKEF